MGKRLIPLLLAVFLLSGCTGEAAETTAPTLCAHLWSDTDCITRSVCLYCGMEGACGAHFFSPATCTYPGTCAVCVAETPAYGHDMLEATCDSPSACSRCGYTEGTPLEHQGEPTCFLCGARTGPRFDIVLEPGTIQRDSCATFAFIGDPETLYSITVYVKSGASSATGLDPQVSDATGYVSWSWWVGSKSTPGTYRIVITGENMVQIVEYTITA